MPYLIQLEMTIYKKVALMITFGLGLVVCIISAVKVALLPTVDASDITFSIQHAMILTILEASLAVILACIPVLRPLFRSALSTLRTKSALANYGHEHTTNRKSQKQNGFSVIEEQPSPPAALQPMPTSRPEIACFSAEAARASYTDHKDVEELELGGLGGITVTTEFVARYSHIKPLS
ncbi:integral membrane protein [Diaporthe helianthi]|uniref:Integral membrane protein n=1 Tax=Diaporthe helianthi TaxID=158607 RepID=A0A2P5I5A1_DIAHE|nr:integral membrane protein [Diaporthe helianthi]